MLANLLENLRLALQPKGHRRADAAEPLGARNLIRRRERLSEGFLTSEQMLTPRPCTLRDMTLLGCRVDLWDDIHPSLIKNGVTLYSLKDKTEVDAVIAWHRGVSLGLRFTCALREPRRNYRI